MKKRSEDSAVHNAVIYARYSSNNQRDVSIDQQVDKCREFAERNGYRIVEVYSDAAMSGKDDNRPKFQKMMRDAKKGGFEFVIAWKSNRIGRNMMQAMLNEEKFRAAGVRCLYVEEDFDDTAAGRFALRNMMNVNQFYIENMAEDILRGLMDNASKCLVNTRPSYGYKKGEDGRFAINEETAPIVKEIFQKYLDGWTYIDIANDLNRRGIKTVLGNDWNKGSFHSMLRNEMYAGVYLYRDVRIDGGVPVIIERDKFEEVQRRLHSKKVPKGKKTGTAEYLLTGKLFCGHCQEPMVGISGTGRHGDVHYYYRCQGKHIKKNGCEKKNVPRDWIEKAVVQYTREFIMNDELLDQIVADYHEFMVSARKDSAVTAMQAELEQNKKATTNIIKAIENGLYDDMLSARLEELRAERKDLESSIQFERAALTEVSPSQLRFILEQFRYANIDSREVQRDLIRIFIRAIYLYDYHLKIIYNFDQNGDHSISFEQACGEDSSDLVSSYEIPSGVLLTEDTNPVTISVFVYGFVLSAVF